MTRPTITLTTDFGESDAYVAVMKGVILSICPPARLIDISHQVRPQAVTGAAYVLSTAVPYFPPGTIHLVVVDPGVGTPRRAVAVQTARAAYVAPDNGVLALTLADDPPLRAVQLTNARYHLPASFAGDERQPAQAATSATFHGRDIFAPAAAHLASGVPLAELGPQIDLAGLRRPDVEPVRLEGSGPWRARVLHVDHFGNAVTNVQVAQLPQPGPGIVVQVAGRRIARMQRTFGDVPPGEVLVYRGSSGYLEIAVNGGSAAEVLGIDVGDRLLVAREKQG